MNVRGNQVCAALTASAPMLIAGLGMLLLPHLMPVWAFVGGCAQGASLVVALALIALRGHDSAETVVHRRPPCAADGVHVRRFPAVRRRGHRRQAFQNVTFRVS